MKKWQVYVVVISLFGHLVASRVETIIEGRTVEMTNKLFEGICGRRTVEIINKLGGGLTLTLHCKSKDNDLGVQTLAPDSSWSFKFTPAFFGTTRFSCNFKWGRESHWFDIYDDDRDVGDKQCYLCSWNIYNGSQGGFTCRFQESTGRYDICYVWDK
ncbi:Plant self-incompatibility protein S1 family [Raphanus sativus]|nr:Plant self-incompatibility protein S1 family [Raphanus sativus]